MSSFCGGTGTIPAMTPSELQERYTNGLLPETMPPMETGLAEEGWLKTYIGQLESTGRIPALPSAKNMQSAPFETPDSKDPLAEFVSKESALYDSLKKEYCFYEKRYFAALDGFLQAIADNSLRGQSQTIVQGRLDATRKLNQKVTLLTQITNAISKYRYSTSNRLQNDINALNATLGSKQKKLMEQREILSKESASADLYKRMVEYTTEKNKANQNLLTLYGVLNITALAMIIYIART